MGFLWSSRGTIFEIPAFYLLWNTNTKSCSRRDDTFERLALVFVFVTYFQCIKSNSVKDYIKTFVRRYADKPATVAWELDTVILVFNN